MHSPLPDPNPAEPEPYESPAEVAGDLNVSLLGVIEPLDPELAPPFPLKELVDPGTRYDAIVDRIEILSGQMPVRLLGCLGLEDDLLRYRLAANLAARLARSGRRVTIVEAEFRRSMVATDPGERDGLIDMLLYGSSYSAVARASGIPGVQMVSAGSHPWSGEPIHGDEWDRVLGAFRHHSDMTLLTASTSIPAPVLGVMARRLDWILIAYALARGSRHAIRCSYLTLWDMDAPILGLVAETPPAAVWPAGKVERAVIPIGRDAGASLDDMERAMAEIESATVEVRQDSGLDEGAEVVIREARELEAGATALWEEEVARLRPAVEAREAPAAEAREAPAAEPESAPGWFERDEVASEAGFEAAWAKATAGGEAPEGTSEEAPEGTSPPAESEGGGGRIIELKLQDEPPVEGPAMVEAGEEEEWKAEGQLLEPERPPHEPARAELKAEPPEEARPRAGEPAPAHLGIEAARAEPGEAWPSPASPPPSSPFEWATAIAPPAGARGEEVSDAIAELERELIEERPKEMGSKPPNRTPWRVLVPGALVGLFALLFWAYENEVIRFEPRPPRQPDASRAVTPPPAPGEGPAVSGEPEAPAPAPAREPGAAAPEKPLPPAATPPAAPPAGAPGARAPGAATPSAGAPGAPAPEKPSPKAPAREGAAGAFALSGYGVHVSSFKTLAKASEDLTRYQAIGYKGVIVAVQVPGRGEWQRVMLGPYPTLDEAESVAKAIREDGLSEKAQALPLGP